eukprot:scaffold1041_cov121-Cylindrotheca_fusiformis.AAC.4
MTGEDASSSQGAASVLDYLSFQASPRGEITTSAAATTSTTMPQSQRMQGVLWKRRDLFKNHWRPRWFVLHHQQHLLTYYLLSNSSNNNNSRSNATPPALASGNRSRTASESSNVTQNTVDYDVVPRGSIYLLGSTVETNPLLTNPAENLYVMTITDHRNATYVHLAARSIDIRQEWIQQIRLVCQRPRPRTTMSQQQRPRRELARLPSTASTTTYASTAAPPPAEPLTLQNAVQPHLDDCSNSSLQWMSAESYPLAPEIYREVEVLLQDMDFDNTTIPWKEQWMDAWRNETDPEISEDYANELGDILEQALPTGSSSSSPTTATGTSLSSFPPTSDDNSSSNSKWSTLSTELLYDNVPPALVQSMEQVLQKYLPYVEHKDHPDLNFKYDQHGVHCSVHKKQQLIRSIRTIAPGTHTPADYLQLLWVFERDLELESNVTLQEPLLQYNVHTTLVYKAYQAVWPTGPREFCSVAHWRLLKTKRNSETGKGGGLALCLLAFSCPEAEELRPRVAPKHVRGHLEVSLQVWEQTPAGCVHTRILSYDLKGQIPRAIIQTVMTQQAELPRIMDAHLTRVKKRRRNNNNNARSSITSVSKLDYEALYQVLKDKNAAALVKKKKKKEKEKKEAAAAARRNKNKASDNDSIVEPSSSLTGTATQSRADAPSIWMESMVLLSPVLCHKLLSLVLNGWNVTSWMTPWVVAVCMVLAVRWICLEHLLRYSILLPQKATIPAAGGGVATTFMKKTTRQGITRCNFSVNLRNIDRFLERKRGREDKQATSSSTTKQPPPPKAEMSHVVIRALARAMAKNPGLIAVRPLPSLPLVYTATTVLHDDTTETTCQAVWIPPQEQLSIPAIAKFLSNSSSNKPNEVTSSQPSFLETNVLGPSCRLWVSDDETQRNRTPIKIDWSAPDSPLTVAISIYLRRQTQLITTKHLQVSLAFQSSDVAACRAFSKEVEQLIQMPEMCDDE